MKEVSVRTKIVWVILIAMIVCILYVVVTQVDGPELIEPHSSVVTSLDADDSMAVLQKRTAAVEPAATVYDLAFAREALTKDSLATVSQYLFSGNTYFSIGKKNEGGIFYDAMGIRIADCQKGNTSDFCAAAASEASSATIVYSPTEGIDTYHIYN